MFNLSLPWWEFIVRGLVVYVVLLILLRLAGRKQVGQLTSIDFVLLLILSNAVQNSMNGGDNSLAGGLIIAVSLVIANSLINYLVAKNKSISLAIEGSPEILIHNGKVNQKIMTKENLAQEDIKSLLRKNGLLNLSEVKYAIIESNGEISLIKNKSQD